MILPTLTNIQWTYAAFAVWEWEPVPCQTIRPADAPASESESTTFDAAPVGDAEPPSQQLVFKGYEWRPVALWDCLANPDWDHWVDTGRHDAADRARSHERSRQTQPPPLVHVAPPVPGTEGDAGAAGGGGAPTEG